MGARRAGSAPHRHLHLSVFSAGPEDASPDFSNSEVEPPAFVITQQKALVIVLIISEREILKIEDSAKAAKDVPLLFSMHKLAVFVRVLSYPAYFDKFIYKRLGTSEVSFCGYEVLCRMLQL